MFTPNPCAEGNSKTSSSSSSRRGVTPPLHAVESFLLALTSASEDGRIFVSLLRPTPTHHPNAKPSHSSDAQPLVIQLKYQLLNPAEHFKEVVTSARSVVLAGGTMHPISDFHSQLFGYLEGGNRRLTSFACGHVVPERNLKCVVVGKGARGGDMTFTFGQRGNKDLVRSIPKTGKEIKGCVLQI